MKSTIQEFQNYFGKSKKIITLGIALMALCQLNAATIRSTTDEQGVSFQYDSLAKQEKHSIPIEDQGVMNPSLVLPSNQKSIQAVILEDRKITANGLSDDGALLFIEKSIDQTIAADIQITEAVNTTEIRPLYLERTLEDKIAEDNAIIESNTIEVQPLDFKNINKKQMNLKKDNNLLLGMN